MSHSENTLYQFIKECQLWDSAMTRFVTSFPNKCYVCQPLIKKFSFHYTQIPFLSVKTENDIFTVQKVKNINFDFTEILPLLWKAYKKEGPFVFFSIFINILWAPRKLLVMMT